jgi:hypothetical protein
MLWTIAAESTHNHHTPAEASTCLICQAAHTASPTVCSSHISPFFATIGVQLEEDAIAKARFDFSDAGIRGPPVL